MLTKLLTIGAFGFDEQSFFKAIVDSGADLFCDIRARRGVRGSEYAFVNSNRLQAALAQRGIRYIHIKDLAPTQQVRDVQYAADKDAGVAKRKRTELSPAFTDAYCRARLDDFDSGSFARESLTDATAPVFFCVEREPKACHRSLVAARLAKDLKVPVEDLTP